MRRLTSLVAVSLLASTVAAIAVPERILLVVRIELVLVVALFVLGTVFALRAAFPQSSQGPFGIRRSLRSSTIPIDLERVHIDLRLASGSATSVERLLVPRFRAIAAARLRRQGLDIADPRHAAACATACGPQLWGFIEPDRALSFEASAPGINEVTLDTILARLEAL